MTKTYRFERKDLGAIIENIADYLFNGVTKAKRKRSFATLRNILQTTDMVSTTEKILTMGIGCDLNGQEVLMVEVEDISPGRSQ